MGEKGIRCQTKTKTYETEEHHYELVHEPSLGGLRLVITPRVDLQSPKGAILIPTEVYEAFTGDTSFTQPKPVASFNSTTQVIECDFPASEMPQELLKDVYPPGVVLDVKSVPPWKVIDKSPALSTLDEYNALAPPQDPPEEEKAKMYHLCPTSGRLKSWAALLCSSCRVNTSTDLLLTPQEAATVDQLLDEGYARMAKVESEYLLEESRHTADKGKEE